MNHHSVLRLFPRGLRKLDLCYCNLGDKDMGYAVWELPNVEKLNLPGNNFSRLIFSLLRFPRLRWLNVSYCEGLVELSKLPSSITVVKADHCISLESIGDISNCKWLSEVSLRGKNKLGPLVGDIILDSMLQGYAIEDHFASVILGHQMIPKGFVGRLFRRKTFALHLPHDWYNDFCGFSVFCVTKIEFPRVNMIIKGDVDEDSRSELWQESHEPREPKYDGKLTTNVGYVSFSSLRHTTLLSSSYNMISVSIDNIFESETETYVGAELVPRRSKGDDVQTTNCSEFWDKERENETTFTIQHDSQSSINILWRPYYDFTLHVRRLKFNELRNLRNIIMTPNSEQI